jgi:MFS family permease
MQQSVASPGGFMGWIDRNFLQLGREVRLSFLPPLMVYVAYGISALTGIVGTFFIKDYLGLSAAFIAGLGFWVGLPWALKVPVGHLVDLFWRYKAGLVYLGAILVACSLLIVVGLLSDPAMMRQTMSAEKWFVLSALLSPIGYVLQDAVADAMTVEAVPRFDESGQAIDAKLQRSMHTTMQTLGRVALIGGGVLVAFVNVILLAGVQDLPKDQQSAVYAKIYLLALIIPLVSIFGVWLAGHLRRREKSRLRARGLSNDEITRRTEVQAEKPPVNWWVLGGGLAFAAVSIVVGLGDFKYGQELIFSASMGIVLFLMWRLLRELSPEARNTLLGTAIVIFVFRALPGTGAGSQWWSIDVLKFDQEFFAKLSLLGSTLTLLGLFLFRRFMAEKSIFYIAGFLTIIGTALSFPTVGMYYGLHEWTGAHTNGFVDQRFIAVIDTALESPLGQIAMVPMLAWIANSAPSHLKATFFAVMASFSNLALSLSNLTTKYMNQIYTVTREVKDPTNGAITTPANYSELGPLLITVILIGLILPFIAIAIAKIFHWRSA